jgi:hypothetical protein
VKINELTIIVDDIYEMESNKKITWISAEGKNTLAARLETDPFRWLVGIGEHDIDPIQEWCEKNNCGKRISFDTFRFRNKKEMTMFLLKWS